MAKHVPFETCLASRELSFIYLEGSSTTTRVFVVHSVKFRYYIIYGLVNLFKIHLFKYDA